MLTMCKKTVPCNFWPISRSSTIIQSVSNDDRYRCFRGFFSEVGQKLAKIGKFKLRLLTKGAQEITVDHHCTGKELFLE
jgi:hypothetical protein